jgi:hypothetical protein
MSKQVDASALRSVLARYPEAERPAFLIAATAMWGLKANAIKHAPVARFLSQFEAKQGSGLAGRTLKAYRAS